MGLKGFWFFFKKRYHSPINGSEFHSLRATTSKSQSPVVFNLDLGIGKKNWLDYLGDLAVTYIAVVRSSHVFKMGMNIIVILGP